MQGLFRFFSLPYLRRRPFKAILTVLGMATGIAVFTSIDLANRSVVRGLEYSLERSAGRSDLTVEGRPALNDEDFARVLNLPEVRGASPVVEGRASCAAGITFTLLGIDPLSSLAFLPASSGAGPKRGLRLLSESAISIPPLLAQNCGFRDGETARLFVGSRPVDAVVLVQEVEVGDESLLAFTDIATAQELLHKTGTLDRIEIALRGTDAETWARRHRDRFDPHWTVRPMRERRISATEILKAFQLNLTALGLVSIFVAGFIVYNAASLSVLYRRSELGALRALGATRGQIGRLFLGEILIFGLLSSLLGILLGWIFARLVFSQVLQTVRDLYLAQAAGHIELSSTAILQSLAIGLGASLLGAAAPLWEALHVAPAEATRRLSYEKRLRHHPLFLLGLATAAFLAAASTVYLANTRRPTFGFAAALFLLLGFLFLTPFVMRAGMLALKWLARRFRLGFAQVAAAQILENPYRYSIVTAAFSLAVALWIGIGAMVSSFRHTVSEWIETSVRGDIYLTLKDNERGRFDSYLPEPMIEAIRKMKEIDAIDSLRQVQVQHEGESLPVSAIELRGLLKRKSFKVLSGGFERFPATVEANDPLPVGIAESLARRKGWSVGDRVAVESPWGRWDLVIAAVFYDYTSERGLFYLDRSDFAARSTDARVNHMALYLKDPAKAQEIAARIESLPDLPAGLRVLLNSDLKRRILDIFEQTFRLTEALKYVALIVAFLGILSTLVLLLEEKRREIGLLQALGMTPLQLSGFALTQGIGLALIGEALGLAAGLALCQVLLKVIHRNYFGWTIFFHGDPGLLAASALLTLATGALASSAALLWLRKIRPSRALRMEE